MEDFGNMIVSTSAVDDLHQHLVLPKDKGSHQIRIELIVCGQTATANIHEMARHLRRTEYHRLRTLLTLCDAGKFLYLCASLIFPTEFDELAS